MLRALFVHLKWFTIAAVFLAGLCTVSAQANVETYTDSAVPPSGGMAEGQPLKSGDLTMQDILRSLPQPKKPAPLPATTGPISLTPPVVATTAPQIKSASPQTSATGTMLMQGMQSALGQEGINTAQTLHPPVTANTVQPTQVVNGISGAPLPSIGSGTPTPASTPATTTATASNGTCTPQVSSWVKTCVEAGYPANYSGNIHGETRTSCPEGTLQDVWVSNGCVPPEGGDAAAAAPANLTSPSPTTVDVTSSGDVIAGADGRADGACGIANGLMTNVRPLYDLCVSGKSTPLAGNGPWHWNCQGIGGGMTVSCAAPVAPGGVTVAANTNNTNTMAAVDTSTSVPNMEDAQCGPADGVVADNAPISGLCNKGAPSRVNGSGPWTWACSGSNGGRAAACNAPKKTDGVCGSSNGSGADEMPMADLCVAGYASAVTGTGPWSWTCSGLNGGQAASCSATPKLNAVCGPASLSGRGDMPKNALCSVGQPSAVAGAGPWSWTCDGLNGGASVPCEARLAVSGVCGLSHGTSMTTIPDENLCANGKPSRVVGDGPWTWNCMGLDGGDTASCTATRSSERVPVPVPPVATPKPTKTSKHTEPTPAPSPVVEEAVAPAAPAADTANLCGSASELVAIEMPSKNLCKSGNASEVSGRGPWVWTCSDSGQQSSCATLGLSGPGDSSPAPAVATPMAPAPAPIESSSATCGSAAGQGLSQEPSDNLCSVGKASSVKGNGPWMWSCSKGKSHTSCQASKIADGACGVANGSVQVSAPVTSLCNSGTPTQVQGNGPWIWSCVGSGGGSSISCSAASQAQTRVNGSCGAATNVAVTATPAANLCDSGVSSAVYGEGPWTWTCSGLNGGIAASCSAQKNTPPAPPPPGPSVNGLCGSSNGVAFVVQPMDSLCSTGDATGVSGNGPWNWNCLGENGGMTVSCTAPLQPPAPISGVCGSSNGVPTLTTPRGGLCSGGIASAVSGKGPWTWSCSGVNGGGAVGCVAPLAGTDVGSLPSMTTPSSGEATTPFAAPTSSVTKRGLVTPRLPSGSLPALQSGNMPPPPMESDMQAPAFAPSLPDDSQGVPPPPVRDTIQPAPALRSDDSGNVLPGNHFVLPTDVSVVPFTHGSENYDSAVLPQLDKLANILAENGGVRITLTAYADNTGTTPREARRTSLSRALALRDYLTSKGISSARIDVRALGANVPSGDPDRVDVKAN